jgi:hypothetical protein
LENTKAEKKEQEIEVEASGEPAPDFNNKGSQTVT